MEKSITSPAYYPRLTQYISESTRKLQDIPRAAKIEDMDSVTTKDGEVIDMKKLKTEMESAKTAIVSQSPLFAPYVHNFTPIYTWLVPTMATDGIRLFVNPKFANDLTWEQKIFVIIHEIMHCVLLHMDRVKARNAKLFNIAGDLEINPLIVDTIADFDEAFVKNIQGLYDKKYLNQPVEKIYADIKKDLPPEIQKMLDDQQDGNQGSGQGEGGEGGEGQPGGGGQPADIPVKAGDKVKIRETGEEGVVTAINPDGTYEVDTEVVSESFYPSINESYTREEIIPIMEGPPPSGGGPADPNNVGGANNPNAEAIYKAMAEHDPAGTGGVMSPEDGAKLAEESGYDVEAGEAGADINAKDKWNVESGKMMDQLEKSTQAGSGKGKALLTTLAKLHRGEVNWKNMFRRYVATALSPEVYQKIGNKKHLGREYLKYGERQKMDAMEHIIVLVDVSGSMSQAVLERILGEINAIIFSKRVKKITVAFFDDGVDLPSVQKITKHGGRPWVPKNVSGGGGTNFQKPLDWVKEKYKDRVSLLVFMTDTYAPMPKKPKYAQKFIWVVYDNPTFKPPFGKDINLS